MMSTINTFGSETRREAKARERHKVRKPRKWSDEQAFAEAVRGAEIADRVTARFHGGTRLLSEIAPRADEDRRQALEKVEGDVTNTLYPLLRSWRELNHAFLQFCAEKGVEPVIEPSYDPIRQNRIIALGLTAEWIAAGVFYGMHLPEPIMGLCWALVPVVFTFVTGFFCALAARRLDRSNRLRTAEAVVGILSFGTLGLAGLLVSAHLRDRFEAEQAGLAHSTLIQDVLSSPLGLSASGWLLLLGSLAAFLFLVHHLYQGREKVPGLAARTSALAQARKSIDEEVCRIDAVCDAAINGTIERAARLIDLCRREVGEGLFVIRGDLQRHGIVDPSQAKSDESQDKAVSLLLDKWRDLKGLQQSIYAIGDL